MLLINRKTGLSYKLDKSTKIGRYPDCGIILNDPKVSRNHAKVYLDGKRYLVEDLGSRNGTFVNDKRISEPTELKDGDTVKVGGAVFIFRSVKIRPADMPTVLSDEEWTKDSVLVHSSVDPSEYNLDAEFATTAADPAGVRLRHRLTTLSEIGNAVRSIRESEAIESEIVRRTLEAFPAAQRCVIILAGRSLADLVVRAVWTRPGFESSKIKIKGKVIKDVLTSRRAITSARPHVEGSLSDTEVIGKDNIYSFMCAPVFVEERAERVIYLDSVTEEAAFSEDDLSLLVLIAKEVAVPLENARLFEELNRERNALREYNVRLREEEGREYDFSQIVGSSPALAATIEMAKRAADAGTTVLITGQSGTGKELFARAIHYNSPRADKPLIIVNCAAIADSLISSELFGHVKGAFTGANEDRKGQFEAAHGGTIVLDEIGDMPLEAQAEVLRVLESGEIRPVGATETKVVDVRIIASTNKELEKEIEAGRFRHDLFYRLNVYPIHIPSLAERKEDVLPLANHFLRYFSDHMNKKVSGFSRKAADILRGYNWPGNVRELKNAVERAVLELGDETVVDEKHLPSEIRRAGSGTEKYKRAGRLPDAVAELEKEMIVEALEETNGNKAEAARRLGLSRAGFRKKLKRYSLE